jgi:hypothetical protein
MDYHQILTLVLTINFVGYIALVLAKAKKVLPSISDSFRLWKGGWGNPFTYFCWVITFTVLPNVPNPFFFFAAGGIGIVGAAFNLDNKYVEKVHGKAAVIGILAAVAGIVYSFSAWWTAGIALGLAGLLALLNVKNKIWWVEIIAFGAVIFEFFRNFFF